MRNLGIGVAAALVVGSAGMARAELPYVQSVHGTACRVDQRTTSTWEYRKQRIVNTSADAFKIAVAVCPLTLYVPDGRATELRVNLSDPQRRHAWCKLYSTAGSTRTVWTDWSGDPSIQTPIASDDHLETTVECLLQSGTSLDTIEIVWLDR